MVLHEPMDALTEALLIFAGRRDHLKQVIEPALARGDVVLCDRFTDATFAYQGWGRGFDIDILCELEVWVQSTATGLRQPDVTIWFELSPDIAAQRLASARVPDRFESQPAAFFEQVSRGYAARAQADPNRFIRLDAAQTREVVWQNLMHQMSTQGWLNA
jgi:dTMP kinase